jgi:hypothetical protein
MLILWRGLDTIARKPPYDKERRQLGTIPALNRAARIAIVM